MFLKSFLLLSIGPIFGSSAQAPKSAAPKTGDNGLPGGIFGPAGSFNLGGKSNLPKGWGLFGGPLGGGSARPRPAPIPAASISPKSSALTNLLDSLLPKGTDLGFLVASLTGGAGSEFPNGTLTPEQWTHPGSGPYPAALMVDPTLPEKTIYAPKKPLINVKMPIIVWGEGGCFKIGSLFTPFLLELASHGYIVLANGPPITGLIRKPSDMAPLLTAGQTKVTDLISSIDWIMAGKGAKYGKIDTSKIAAAGQSCGGAEALSVSYHNDKVKLTILLNSGSFGRKNLLKEFKYPVGIFNGGPKDIAYRNGEQDYTALRVPTLKANLNTGHVGTYFTLNGGKFGKAVVAFLEWQFRGDARSKAICLDPESPGSLVSDHWNVTYKGFK